MAVNFVNKQIPGVPTIGWAQGKPTAIVLHETANPSNKGSYNGEVRFVHNNWRNAFYHAIADETGVAVVHDPDIGGAWGSGPSMHKYAIHIELVRSSTRVGFQKAYKNWIEAARYYAKKYNIPLTLNSGRNKNGIYTHKYITQTFGGTTHQDPDAYLAQYGVTIAQLAKDLGSDAPISAKPVGNPTSSPKVDANKTNSIVDYLNAKGINSSPGNRKKLAVKYGVKGYNLSKEKNTELLNAMRDGNKPSDKPTGKSIATMAKEVIAGKHGSGHASRQKSLGVSKATYDKVRAEVNRQSGVATSKPKKSISQMADEIIAGKHGSGHANRRKSLGVSQTVYNQVKDLVNKRASGKTSKSIGQMANEIIAGKHGSGHANRRKSLGISQATYNQVRAEVNKRA